MVIPTIGQNLFQLEIHTLTIYVITAICEERLEITLSSQFARISNWSTQPYLS